MKEKKKNDKGLSTLEYLQMLQILHLSNNLQSEHSLLSSHRLMFKNNKTTKVWNPDEQFMQTVTLGVFILSVDSQTGWTAVKTALFHLQHFTLVFVVCPPPHLALWRELYPLYPFTLLLVRFLSSRQLSCGNNSKQTPSGHRYAGNWHMATCPGPCCGRDEAGCVRWRWIFSPVHTVEEVKDGV